MESKRYPTLRFVRGGLQFIGWLGLIISLLLGGFLIYGSIAVPSSPSQPSPFSPNSQPTDTFLPFRFVGIYYGLAIIYGGVTYYLIMLAIADLIGLLLDMEQNTRAAAQYAVYTPALTGLLERIAQSLELQQSKPTQPTAAPAVSSFTPPKPPEPPPSSERSRFAPPS